MKNQTADNIVKGDKSHPKQNPENQGVKPMRFLTVICLKIKKISSCNKEKTKKRKMAQRRQKCI